jgi:hypothetical protein
VTPRTRPGLYQASSAEPDEVVRLQAFRQQYPHVTIGMISAKAWQACVCEPDDGKTVITRRELKDLLDSLKTHLEPPADGQ